MGTKKYLPWNEVTNAPSMFETVVSDMISEDNEWHRIIVEKEKELWKKTQRKFDSDTEMLIEATGKDAVRKVKKLHDTPIPHQFFCYFITVLETKYRDIPYTGHCVYFNFKDALKGVYERIDEKLKYNTHFKYAVTTRGFDGDEIDSDYYVSPVITLHRLERPFKDSPKLIMASTTEYRIERVLLTLNMNTKFVFPNMNEEDGICDF